MQTTRSRRYDDPVEDQPAEDPLLINHPPREQKERSNAAGKSRRLAAKTNNSSPLWDRAKEYSASEHTSLERSKR